MHCFIYLPSMPSTDLTITGTIVLPNPLTMNDSCVYSPITPGGAPSLTKVCEATVFFINQKGVLLMPLSCARKSLPAFDFHLVESPCYLAIFSTSSFITAATLRNNTYYICLTSPAAGVMYIPLLPRPIDPSYSHHTDIFPPSATYFNNNSISLSLCLQCLILYIDFLSHSS